MSITADTDETADAPRSTSRALHPDGLNHGPPPPSADIVIIGAGVAGLYSAWRLLQQDQSRSVVVIEKLGRIGGRLQTDHVPVATENASGGVVVTEVKDEEGGMRFNFGMQELIQLSSDLGLCDQISLFGGGDGNNRYYIRGRNFTVAESAADDHALWSELYDLRPNERGKSPAELLDEVYLAILAENGMVPPEDPQPEFWQQFRLDFTYLGIPMNEWAMRNLLKTVLSNEAISMIADTAGFQEVFMTDKANAGKAFELLEGSAAETFYTFNDGYSILPNTLAEEIVGMGGSIHIGATVVSVRDDGGLAVVVNSTPGVRFSPARERYWRHVTEAETIILALPRQAMTRLARNSPAIRRHRSDYRRMRTLMESVAESPLLKVNLYFHTAWWHNGQVGIPPITDGGNFTTLPAGSFYVFIPMMPDPDEPSSLDAGLADGPAALTLYCDYSNADFWAAQQEMGRNPRIGYFTSPLQEHFNRQRPQLVFPASQAVVDEMMRELRDVFGAVVVPAPILSSFRYWDGHGGFGFAAHQWKPFVDDRAVIPSMVQPIPGLEVYTCNEAWSDEQGWVNGSLRSAELMLTEVFGTRPLIPDPDTWTSPCPIPPDPEDDRLPGPTSQPPGHIRPGPHVHAALVDRRRD